MLLQRPDAVPVLSVHDEEGIREYRDFHRAVRGGLDSGRDQ